MKKDFLVNQDQISKHVQHYFRDLAIFRREIGIVSQGTTFDKSTVALLKIGNQSIYGSNTSTVGLNMK